MVVLKYKCIDPKCITLGPPTKQQGQTFYSSKILYNQEEMTLQTPVITLENQNTAKFSLVGKGELFSVFEEIRERLVDTLYTNSEKFFNGKKFTESRIEGSLRRPVVINEDDKLVHLHGTKVSETVKVFDTFNDDNSINYPSNGTCIINVKCLKFIKKDIIVEMIITHFKADYKQDKKKPEECILGVVEETLEPEVEEEIDSETGPDFLELGVENTDSLDFFD